MSQREVPGLGNDTVRLFDASTGNETYSLPTSFAVGRKLVVRRSDSTTNTVTISAPTGQSLDGVTDGTKTVAGDSECWFSLTNPGIWESFGGAGGVQSVAGKAGAVTGSDIAAAASANAPLSAANAPNLRRKLAQIRAGMGSMKWLFAGDSTMWGAGNGSPGAGWDPTKAAPTIVAALLDKYMVPARQTVFIAPSSIAGAGHTITTDPRWTVGAGWILSTQGFGTGSAFQAPNGITTNLVLTPGNGNVDTFDIYYVRAGITGTFDAKIDAGSVTTFGSAGANAVQKATLTTTVGTNHTLTVTPKNTGSVFILFVEAYNSTESYVRVAPCGVSSSTSTNWNSTGTYNARDCIRAWAPDMTTGMLGINDARQNFSVATHNTNMTAIFNDAALTGDVMLMSVLPSNHADATYGASTALYEPQYATSDAALCASRGWAYIDLYNRFGPFAAANAAGYYYDNFHGTQQAYADIAGAVFNEARKATQ